jgi:muconate cycloisomerase
LWFYKLFSFKTVKIKVGRDFDGDLERVILARKVLGPSVTLRADANCAWNAEEALQCAERFRPYNIASYEQPVPADDLEGLARISRNIPEDVLADESLCSIEQARLLAAEKICTAFNIRVSKVGGVLAATEISRIAEAAGINRHMGAQVGESGILSAAGRAFASTQPQFDNYEGSNNFFLLKKDITAENLNVGYGGGGKLLPGNGLGVTVLDERINEFFRANSESASVVINTESTRQADDHITART